MNILRNIVDAINQCPEYIGKGVINLLLLTIGGIIVAVFSTSFFGRKNEINAVEGALLQKKLDIYEELSRKLELLKSMVIIPSVLYSSAVSSLKEEKIVIAHTNENQILEVFDSPENLLKKFLEIDTLITSKKLYFDDQVLIQSLRFQNYFAALRRLMVVFEQEFVDFGIELNNGNVAAAERLLTIELGILLQDEFVNQLDKLISTMKSSFKNLDLKHRSKNKDEYSYDFYNRPDGPILSELLKTKLLSEREKIMNIVTKAVALGMSDRIISDK